MTTTSITASQIKPGDTVEAEFAGVRYTGKVRSVHPALFSTALTRVPHLLIIFAGGGSWPNADQSISIPASQQVERH